MSRNLRIYPATPSLRALTSGLIPPVPPPPTLLVQRHPHLSMIPPLRPVHCHRVRACRSRHQKVPPKARRLRLSPRDLLNLPSAGPLVPVLRKSIIGSLHERPALHPFLICIRKGMSLSQLVVRPSSVPQAAPMPRHPPCFRRPCFRNPLHWAPRALISLPPASLPSSQDIPNRVLIYSFRAFRDAFAPPGIAYQERLASKPSANIVAKVWCPLRLFYRSEVAHYCFQPVFTHKKNLTTHLKEQHDPNHPHNDCPYPGCTASYLRPNDLKNHMAEKHPVLPSPEQ